MGFGGLQPHIGQPPGVPDEGISTQDVPVLKSANPIGSETPRWQAPKTRPKPPVTHYSFLEDTPSSKYHLPPPHTVFEVSSPTNWTVSTITNLPPPPSLRQHRHHRAHSHVPLRRRRPTQAAVEVLPRDLPGRNRFPETVRRGRLRRGWSSCLLRPLHSCRCWRQSQTA
ncbi:Vng6424h (plasmid) [Halobacterium salinarum NRC-1]|uniref:Spurious ORF n=1 Tax=Halobacterium salinarum (strain ATCC 700922 / JCM 11081 / NRC-1) TaxID=64091 RepID=Q9HHF7_HALSA|nr:Vng6424h [Halobacterium salinarum NRC-1]DAC79996.1 TPA_inf: spurious ORF [Halobacterium salinarum NRC-1]